MYFLLLDDKQHEPWERGMRAEKRRWRRRRKRMLMKTQHCSSSSLQQRIESLQRHIDILRSARKDAVLSARELRSANEKIMVQLNSLTEKLNNGKQLTQVTHTGSGGGPGRWVKEKDGSKCRDVFYIFVFVFIFLVLLYLVVMRLQQ